MSARRVTVLWFPDFPVYAVGVQREWNMLEPAMVLAEHRVHACNAAARRHGVHQGMKQRHALATCPQIAYGPADPVQEAAIHEDIISAVMDVAADAETLRPGLIALPAGPLENYYGSEAAAVELLLDAAARLGVECLAGTADDLMPAVWAARRGRTIPAGENREFISNLPIAFLGAEPSLSAPKELVDVLSELGISRLGGFAALERKHVAGRFGSEAVYWHRVASGEPGRELSSQRVADPVQVVHEVESAIQSTETAAFVARQAAARLHGELFRRGDACLKLVVRAHLNPPVGYTGAKVIERVWRCRDPLSQEDTAQRVRWQLDGWLTRLRPKLAAFGEDGVADNAVGVVAIELIPTEVVPAGSVAEPLWGGADEGIRAARAAAGRAQALIGMSAVQQAIHQGGYAVGGRVLTLPYGEQAPEDVENLPTTQWQGELPAPLPATVGPPPGGGSAGSGGGGMGPRGMPRGIDPGSGSAGGGGPAVGHPASRIAVLDGAGGEVHVTGRGVLSSSPEALQWGQRTFVIQGWAGPWPVDEQWWAQGRRYARMQVSTEEGAYLLVSRGQKWRIEATY